MQSLRTALSRLLISGGRIIVIGDKLQIASRSDYDVLDNYCWSPLLVRVTPESGISILGESVEFPGYLARLKRWVFFYSIAGVSDEFRSAVGNSHQPNLEVDSYLVNREGRLLAGVCHCSVIFPTGRRRLGDFVFLPVLEELEQRAAVNLILEDLLGHPQTTLPPDWVNAVPMPHIAVISHEIEERRSAIRAFEAEIEKYEAELLSLNEYKKLVYASGQELEDIFGRCLGECGGTVKPAQYSQEEFVLEYKGSDYLVECKGVGKSIGLTDARQLLNHKLDYEQQAGQPGKGILLGNAWRHAPLEQRGQSDTPIFPENVLRLANNNDMALVWSVDFFRAFCRVLDKEITGDVLLDRITGSIGIVEFADLLR